MLQLFTKQAIKRIIYKSLTKKKQKKQQGSQTQFYLVDQHIACAGVSNSQNYFVFHAFKALSFRYRSVPEN